MQLCKGVTMNNQKFMRNINIISRCATAYRDECLLEYGLTGNQAPYISIICSAPGITPKEIAQKMHVNKSTVTRVLDKLEKNNFIKQLRSDTDKRTLEVFPTEQANKIKDVVHGTFRQWKKLLTTVLTVEELESIEKLTEILMKRAIEINENNL